MEFAHAFAPPAPLPTLDDIMNRFPIPEPEPEPEPDPELWIKLDNGEKVSIMIDDNGDFFEVDENGNQGVEITFHRDASGWEDEARERMAESLVECDHYWADMIAEMASEHASMAESEELLEHYSPDISEAHDVEEISPELLEEHLVGTVKVATFGES